MVRGASTARVDSWSSDAAIIFGLEAGSEVGADLGIGSRREFEVKASGFSGSQARLRTR